VSQTRRSKSNTRKPQAARAPTPVRRSAVPRVTPTAPSKSDRPAARSAAAKAEDPRRKLYILLSLVIVMSATSVLLLAMRTDPLVPDTSRSLVAVDAPGSIERVFDTKVPLDAGRWSYIFIHHSQTPGGNADSLAEGDGDGLIDHFVIGNGDGCADGAIQIGRRWDQQRPAGRISGIDRMDPQCISICLIGDFDHGAPTPTQMHRLGQLVTALQKRLKVAGDHVWVVNADQSPAGAGRNFPRAAFRQLLLP
jgi:hypothetical protein